MKKVFVIISILIILIVIFVFLFIDVEKYRVGVADTPAPTTACANPICLGTFGPWISKDGAPMYNYGNAQGSIPVCNGPWSPTCGTLKRSYTPNAGATDNDCTNTCIPNLTIYTCAPCGPPLNVSVNSCQTQTVKTNPDSALVSANTTASTIIGSNDPSMKVDSATIANYSTAYKNYVNAIGQCNTPATYDSANRQFVCPSTSPVATITNGFVTCST
uniref:Uncharacterized protein n=1 Tax=viral metagenome TaxID=1070528 RepID=A0A6C0KH69_9ZZZZ